MQGLQFLKTFLRPEQTNLLILYTYHHIKPTQLNGKPMNRQLGTAQMLPETTFRLLLICTAVKLIKNLCLKCQSFEIEESGI